jgi:hypothetical protein
MSSAQRLKSIVVSDTDVLEHANRDDAVEPAANVAIVLQQEFRRIGQPLFARAGVCDVQLLGGQGHASHIGAGHLGQIEGQTAPTRVYVECRIGIVGKRLEERNDQHRSENHA